MTQRTEDIPAGRLCFPVHIHLNPSGYAAADCSGVPGSSEPLALRFGFVPSSATEEEYCTSISEGFSTYLELPPEESAALPAGPITIERIHYHDGTSKPAHFKILGAFIVREYQKLLSKART